MGQKSESHKLLCPGDVNRQRVDTDTLRQIGALLGADTPQIVNDAIVIIRLTHQIRAIPLEKFDDLSRAESKAV
jgi:hypothetical protein